MVYPQCFWIPIKSLIAKICFSQAYSHTCKHDVHLGGMIKIGKKSIFYKYTD